MKTKDCPAEMFDEFIAYYALDGRCEGFEFYDDADVTFNGIRLLSSCFSATSRQLSKLDPLFEEDEEGLVSERFGLAIWAPFQDDEGKDREVKSVCFEIDLDGASDERA